MIRQLVLSLFVFLHFYGNAQYFGQPMYYYQPQPIVPQIQQPIFYQPVQVAPSYNQYPSFNYPQYEYHHPISHHSQYVPNYPVSYPINVETTNNLANLLLLRELENSRNGGNEFRDREGAFEEQNRLFNAPIGPNDHSKYLSLISDKDNFQVSGCSWDLIQMKCVDGLGLCKGGCRDFAVTTTAALHDCRCVPYGYAALLKLAGKK